MSRKIFDTLVNLFGNHPVFIFLGIGVLYFILELIEAGPFMKKVVSSSFYSFTKKTFFTVMLLSLIGAYVYQTIFVEINKFKKAAKALDLTYHLKNHPTKKHHWHIDYLSAAAIIKDVWFSGHSDKYECRWTNILKGVSGLQQPVPGFGSSDCSCHSHLFYRKKKPLVTHYEDLLGCNLNKKKYEDCKDPLILEAIRYIKNARINAE